MSSNVAGAGRELEGVDHECLVAQLHLLRALACPHLGVRLERGGLLPI